MKYIVIAMVVLLVAIYGFQVKLPTGYGALVISSEHQVKEQMESYDGDLSKYK